MSLIENYSGSTHCAWCCNTGQVCAGQEVRGGHGYDQQGPCPACQLGHRLEFGIGVDRNGRDFENPRPPWGKDGYWRGQDWQKDLIPACTCAERPLSPAENSRMMNELLNGPAPVLKLGL